MAKDTFQLDIPAAGQAILQDMAAGVVREAGQAILDRAVRMESELSGNPAGFALYTSVGTIKQGRRAIATVKANDNGSAHAAYVAREALVKAKDAGRV